ncbi:MAG TPA: sigma-70 family RNA polymerase sigma factor [Polyangiaceae bacterium]|nr:sigma-70 family RNA polymerase sigma factor [Polyangiaceae bacterium]
MAQPLIGTEALRPRLEGEHAARLSRLIRAQLGFVWRLLRRVGVSESEADVALQQVFVAAAQRIGDIRSGNERSFLFSTALHVAARMQREPSSQVVLSDTAPALEDLDDQQQSREILAVLLSQMPLELRVVFVLHEIEQLPSSEIASIVGIPESTVATRLSEALDDFATHLETGSDLSESLMIAAREERSPPYALSHTLAAVGLSAVHVDTSDSESAALSSPEVSSQRVQPQGAPGASYGLAVKWLGIGLALGLTLTVAVYALSDVLSGR